MSWKGQFLWAANRLLRALDIQVVRYRELRRPTAAHLAREPPPGVSYSGSETPFLKVFQGSGVDLRDSFDFTVVMPTTLRPTINRALRSIFSQQYDGRVQVWIGVDVPLGSLDLLQETCRAVPARQCVFCFYPGYSTSRRHGGQHAAGDGGALRTVLSYLANSRFVAYLDDDNWWSSDHLASLHQALNGAEWAYSLRWFVHPDSGRSICKDEWESIGPGRGVFRQYGGWADPNGIAINKQVCEAVLPWWAIPMRNSPNARAADRNVFRILSREFNGRATGQYTVFYTVNEADSLHKERLRLIGAERYAAAAHPVIEPGLEETRISNERLA
ncbi:MAG TPA: glycosyltransferase family A protein [Candidatus Binataceae bacterium]|nr:glycosyltransferase family A protein [Candidatus Binataceae bacterium]